MPHKHGDKVAKVMGEYKHGTLRSSSGRKVTKPAQAKAIALDEARRAGQKVAPKPKTRRGPSTGSGRGRGRA